MVLSVFSKIVFFILLSLHAKGDEIKESPYKTELDRMKKYYEPELDRMNIFYTALKEALKTSEGNKHSSLLDKLSQHIKNYDQYLENYKDEIDSFSEAQTNIHRLIVQLRRNESFNSLVNNEICNKIKNTLQKRWDIQSATTSKEPITLEAFVKTFNAHIEKNVNDRKALSILLERYLGYVHEQGASYDEITELFPLLFEVSYLLKDDDDYFPLKEFGLSRSEQLFYLTDFRNLISNSTQENIDNTGYLGVLLEDLNSYIQNFEQRVNKIDQIDVAVFDSSLKFYEELVQQIYDKNFFDGLDNQEKEKLKQNFPLQQLTVLQPNLHNPDTYERGIPINQERGTYDDYEGSRRTTITKYKIISYLKQQIASIIKESGITPEQTTQLSYLNTHAIVPIQEALNTEKEALNTKKEALNTKKPTPALKYIDHNQLASFEAQAHEEIQRIVSKNEEKNNLPEGIPPEVYQEIMSIRNIIKARDRKKIITSHLQKLEETTMDVDIERINNDKDFEQYLDNFYINSVYMLLNNENSPAENFSQYDLDHLISAIGELFTDSLVRNFNVIRFIPLFYLLGHNLAPRLNRAPNCNQLR